MKTLHLPFVFTASLLAFSLQVQGALVITNGSFEADGTGSNFELITGWFEESSASDDGSNPATAEQALWEGTNTNIPDAADGSMWGHFIDRGGEEAIYQDLGVWNTGDALSYSLTATLGDRSNQDFEDLTIEFWSVDAGDAGMGAADGSTFASSFTTQSSLASDVATMTDGNVVSTAAYAHQFDFNALNLADGDNIWLRISQPTGNGHSLIDNISIAVVPEPGSLLLLCLAGGCLALTRLSRKSRH